MYRGDGDIQGVMAGWPTCSDANRLTLGGEQAAFPERDARITTAPTVQPVAAAAPRLRARALRRVYGDHAAHFTFTLRAVPHTRVPSRLALATCLTPVHYRALPPHCMQLVNCDWFGVTVMPAVRHWPCVCAYILLLGAFHRTPARGVPPGTDGAVTWWRGIPYRFTCPQDGLEEQYPV